MGNPGEFPVCGVSSALPTHQQCGRLSSEGLCICSAGARCRIYVCVCVHTVIIIIHVYVYLRACGYMSTRVCVYFMEVSGFTLSFI